MKQEIGTRTEIIDDSNLAISVKNLHKSFNLPTEQSFGLKQAIFNRLRGIKGYKEQKVLKGISFEIKKGEFVGIIGRNGSGKSTLMRKWIKCMTIFGNLPSLKIFKIKNSKTIPPACKFVLPFQLLFVPKATSFFLMKSSPSAMLLFKKNVMTILQSYTMKRKRSFLSLILWTMFDDSALEEY